MMPDFDERSVVDAARAGDQHAVGLLYDAYVTRVYRFAYGRLGSREDAEDVTAEVFIKVVDGLHRFAWRENVPFGAWLFRIARNEVVSHLRKARARPLTRPIDDALPLAEEDTASDESARADAIREIKRVTAELSPAQREVIEFRFGAGLSVAETAHALNKTENNVKVLQHKAIANLRSRLKRQ
jgi:RNA polymerase sigma-70 factor (ECF subfamily)